MRFNVRSGNDAGRLPVPDWSHHAMLPVPYTARFNFQGPLHLDPSTSTSTPLFLSVAAARNLLHPSFDRNRSRCPVFVQSAVSGSW